MEVFMLMARDDITERELELTTSGEVEKVEVVPGTVRNNCQRGVVAVEEW